MRLLINKDYAGACCQAAYYIAKRIRVFNPQKEKPFVLGLPTGSSPLGIYRELIRKHREENLSFANVASFNMDEYAGLPPDHPQSYARFMKENFFNSIDILPENTHIPNGMAGDLEAECRSYEESIVSAGGIELFLGGMGGNGHLAFNEPGSSLASRTRLMTLNRDTLAANARFFDGNIEKVPKTALTVGIQTIMDAREVLIIVSGSQKAAALAAAVEGGVSHWRPLSCLQMHPHAIIVCDEAAAGELKFSTVQYFLDIESSRTEGSSTG
ncbi:MAG: glucosamine-6-phosphate deaminase [Treponema sp.]|jgi:glucosamine-6-phosphate deaminase|nr:glucosamine-6-phosphate deaminase [Treponema sp.]